MNRVLPPESAFPSHGSMGEVVEPGMTLRDYFAAKAMVALIDVIANGLHDLPARAHSGDAIAGEAYKMADAMLKERAK